MNFPTDEETLVLLDRALTIAPGSERTSLHDLLDLLSPPCVPECHEVDDSEGIPIVTCGDACGGKWTDHDVIAALITEVRGLRSLLDAAREAVAKRSAGIPDGSFYRALDRLASVIASLEGRDAATPTL